MSVHYGASIGKTGRLSQHPYEGHQYKTIVRIDKLVSFDIFKASNPTGGLSDAEIAKAMGTSERYIQQIRKKPFYLKRRMERTTGIALNNDFTVEQTVALNRKVLKEMMPVALRVIADQLQTIPQTLDDKKHIAKIALEVLDREGTFPKISRTDVHQKVEHDWSKADGVSKELLDAMEGPAQEAEPVSILEQLKITQSFSNSETLSSETQSKLMGELESMPTPSDTVN